MTQAYPVVGIPVDVKLADDALFHIVGEKPQYDCSWRQLLPTYYSGHGQGQGSRGF